MNKSFITVNNISKSFNEKSIIKNLSFNINKGDLVKISGSNGAGKSTLLKIIARIYNQDSGEIKIGGENINKSSLSKSMVSYVSSDSVFYKDLTVKKNIIFYFNLIGERKSKEIYEKNKHFLKLSEFEDLYPEILSNGQKKKMNLFRTLIPNYDIYLIDEPENGLDGESKKELDQKLNSLSNKSTIIYTSHNSNSLSIYKKTTKEILL